MRYIVLTAKHELCQWCLQKFATHWALWTQEPTGRGQTYARTFCDKCWQAAGAEDVMGEWEMSRDEWLVAKTMHG